MHTWTFQRCTKIDVKGFGSFHNLLGPWFSSGPPFEKKNAARIQTLATGYTIVSP